MDLLGTLLSFVRWRSGNDAASIEAPLRWPDALRPLGERLRGYTWAGWQQGDAQRILGVCSLSSPWRYGLAQVESAVFAPALELHRLRGIERDELGHYLFVEITDLRSVRAILALQAPHSQWHLLDEHVLLLEPRGGAGERGPDLRPHRAQCAAHGGPSR